MAEITAVLKHRTLTISHDGFEHERRTVPMHRQPYVSVGSATSSQPAVLTVNVPPYSHNHHFGRIRRVIMALRMASGSTALFNNPRGIAVDNNTNVYVTDLYNHTIRKLTPSGTNWVVSTIAGLAGSYGSADGTNSNARFNGPYGIAVDGGQSLCGGHGQQHHSQAHAIGNELGGKHHRRAGREFRQHR